MINLPIKIKGTAKTPEMEFRPRESLITMTGVSVPENAKEFYDPILSWLDALVANAPQEEIKVEIKLRYFSIMSSRFLLKIFQTLQKLPKVTIYWYYEDSDTREIGADYATILNAPIILVQREK